MLSGSSWDLLHLAHQQRPGKLHPKAPVGVCDLASGSCRTPLKDPSCSALHTMENHQSRNLTKNQFQRLWLGIQACVINPSDIIAMAWALLSQ